MDESYCVNLCSDLGVRLADGSSGFRFVKNEGKCLKTLKRIRKELNADAKSENNSALVLFGELGLVRNYLLPLALQYGESDRTLLAEVTKVLVQLTMPLGAGDHAGNADKRLEHLRSIKAQFVQPGAMQAFLTQLDAPLAGSALSTKGRDPDKMVVELVLWLLRNLLAVPNAVQGAASTKNAHHTHLHEDFLNMLGGEGVLDLVVFLGEYVGTGGNTDWNLILLEIFYQVFRGAHAEDLFAAAEPGAAGAAGAAGAVGAVGAAGAGATAAASAAAASSAAAAAAPPAAALPAARGPVGRQQARDARAELVKASTQKDDRLASLLLKSRQQRVQASKLQSSRPPSFAGVLTVHGPAGSSSIVNDAFAASHAATRSVAADLRVSELAGTSKKKRKIGEEDAVELRDQAQQEALLGADRRALRGSGSRKVRRTQHDLCARLVDRCYEPLFTALKKDLSRDDQRLLPTDRVQFMHLVALCTGFERARVARLAPGDGGDGGGGHADAGATEKGAAAATADSFAWHKSPVMRTMDKWTFSFVIAFCTIYTEQGKVTELEAAVAALNEMVGVLVAMQSSRDPQVRAFVESLRNTVFHNMRELDLVPNLIADFKEGEQSWQQLRGLAQLGRNISLIAHAMEADKVLVLARGRGASGAAGADGAAQGKTGKPWGAEETLALAEAARSFGGASLPAFRRALKDQALGQILDKSRTPVMMMHRWAEVEAALKQDPEGGVEALVAREAAGRAAEGEHEEEESEAERRRRDKALAAARKESVASLVATLKPYTHSKVLRRLCDLLDPGRVPQGVPESQLRDLHEVVLVELLGHVKALAPGALWQIQLFATFARCLEEWDAARRPRLNALLRELIASFFAHARTSPLAFVELLLFRTARDNELMLNGYEDTTMRKQRLREEQERIEQEERRLLQEERYEEEQGEEQEQSEESESDDAQARKEGGAEAVERGEQAPEQPKGNKLRLLKYKKRRRAESESEEEADLDKIEFTGKLVAAGKRARTARARAQWTLEQSRRLVEHFERVHNPSQDAVQELLVLSEALAEPGMSIEDLRDQVARLRLAPPLRVAPRLVDAEAVELGRALVHAVEAGLSAAVRWLLAAVEGGHQVLVATDEAHWAALESAHFCQHLLEPLGLYQDPASRLWKMQPHQHKLVPLQRIRALFDDAEMGRLEADGTGPVDDDRRGRAASADPERYDRAMDLLP